MAEEIVSGMSLKLTEKRYDHNKLLRESENGQNTAYS